MFKSTVLGRSVAAFALGAMVLSTPLSINNAGAHEPYFKDRPSPECHDEKMLKRIVKRFRIQAQEVHHDPSLEIVEIHDIHQNRYLPQDVHLSRAIARRYCQGHVHMSDGRKRSIWYLIEGGAGFASYADNVEFCISGLDRWNVYNASCRVLR